MVSHTKEVGFCQWITILSEYQTFHKVNTLFTYIRTYIRTYVSGAFYPK